MGERVPNACMNTKAAMEKAAEEFKKFRNNNNYSPILDAYKNAKINFTFEKAAYEASVSFNGENHPVTIKQKAKMEAAENKYKEANDAYDNYWAELYMLNNAHTQLVEDYCNCIIINSNINIKNIKECSPPDNPEEAKKPEEPKKPDKPKKPEVPKKPKETTRYK